VPLISASGQKFAINNNSTGIFVTNGNVTSRIVKSDALVQNGVVHYINGVFMNFANDEDSASRAFQSATSIASLPTTETGPIGVKATPTTGTNAGDGNNSRNVGQRTSGLNEINLIGWVLVAIGMVIGGRSLLA
jgi:hypothetical protein